MSRTTLSPAKRGVAGLTAAVLTAGTVGFLLAGSAAAADHTITTATVANPAATKTAPTIDAAGPFTGKGGAVSIVGTAFPATPTVTFGGTAATNVLRVSDTLILAKAPSATGTADTAVDLVVAGTKADGSSAGSTTKTGGYTYKAAPTVSDAAYSADKKTLVVTGTYLDDATSLQLGPLAIKLKSTDSTATEIKVKVPAALTKAKYGITVETYWGSGSLSSDWSVIPVPAKILAATSTSAVKSADSLNPNAVVRITGKSLSSVDSVSFGGAVATFFVSSDTELIVQVPPMAATETVKTNIAKVNVVVKNGSLSAAKPLTFEYKVAPIVTAVGTAATATIVGNVTAATNTVVTITGSNLSGAKLYFGSAKGAKNLSPKSGSSATSASFVMPKAAATGFVLGTPYQLWVVTKGGNLDTGRTITVE